MQDPAERAVPNGGPDLQEQIRAQVNAKTDAQLRQDFDAVQPVATELKQDIDNNREAAETNMELPETMRKPGQKKNNLNRITEVVKQTLVAINQPNQSKIAIPEGSADILRDLAKTVLGLDGEVSNITEKNALFIDEIIRLGLQNRLSSFENLLAVFNSMRYLDFIQGEHEMHAKIARVLQRKAKSVGASEAQLDQLKTEQHRMLDKQTAIDSQPQLTMEAIRKEADRYMDTIRAYAQSFSPASLTNSTYEREIVKEVDAMHLEGDEGTRMIERLKNDVAADLSSRLEMAFNNIIKPNMPPIPASLSDEEAARLRRQYSVSPLSETDITNNLKVFNEFIRNMSSQGVMQPQQIIELGTLASNFAELGKQYTKDFVEIQQKEQYKQATSLWSKAEQIMGGRWTQKKKLIEALDDETKFETYIKKYNNLKELEDWQALVKDVRELFEILFENAEANPKHYWQESFYEFHEGHLYKQFIGALRTLGQKISKYESLKSKDVAVWDYYFKTERLADPNLRKVIPKPELIGKKKVKVNMAIALESILTNEMIDYKDLTEYGHNVNVLSQQGAGFDKLAEFSARLRTRDVIRLVASIPGLSETYNLYLENMMTELSLNDHIYRPSFGSQDFLNMDSVERETYAQLIAGRTGFSERTQTDPEAIRLIRLASGLLGKGFTGEFWGTAWTSYAPMRVKTVIDKSEKIGEREVIVHGVRKRIPIYKIHYEPDYSYMSLSDPGIEKMLPSIDVMLAMIRFNLHKIFPEIRSGIVPRKWDEDHPELTNWDHNILYELHKEKEEAIFNGRTDRLAKIDKKYKFSDELARTNSIDLLKRGGWRIYEYRNFFVFETEMDEQGRMVFKTDPNSHPQKYIVDFKATIRQLQGIGPYYVKQFLDDLFKTEETDYQADVSPLKIEELDRDVLREYEDRLKRIYSEEKKHNRKLKGEWEVERDLTRRQKELSDGQRDYLWKLFYNKYIFQELRKQHPSHFIAMETRRWIPRDEVEGQKTVRDRLLHKLYQIYAGEIEDGKYTEEYIQDNFLPLYIGAVQIAENDVWQTRKNQWEANRQRGHFWLDPGESDPLNYMFSENVFDQRDLQEKIRRYFRYKKIYTGVQQDPGRVKMVIDDENIFAHLKDFTRALRGAIDEDRWELEKHISDPNNPEYNKETLTYRYARMMKDEQGNIDYYIKGNYLDLTQVNAHQAGSRGTERWLGETMGVMQGATTTLREMITNSFSGIVKQDYKDMQTYEQAVAKLFAEPFKKIQDAIANIDFNQANEYIKNWQVIAVEMIAKDKLFRYQGTGFIADFLRRLSRTQQSYLTDKIPTSPRQPSFSADSQHIESFIRITGDAVDMPRLEETAVGVKSVKIFGRPLKIFGRTINKPVFKANKNSQEQVIKALGVTRDKQIIESVPMIGPILIIILLLLAKLAADKNKGK